MTTAVTVRTATSGDVPAIADIHVSSWRAAYAGLLPPDYLSGSVDRHERGWGRGVADTDPRAALLVVVDGDDVVGFAYVGPSRDDDADDTTAELYAIYLHPTRWRRGLGRALHEGAVGLLTERGWSRVTLWVSRGDARARRFAESVGWRPDGVSRKVPLGQDGIDLDEVRYVRPLSGPATAST